MNKLNRKTSSFLKINLITALTVFLSIFYSSFALAQTPVQNSQAAKNEQAKQLEAQRQAEISKAETAAKAEKELAQKEYTDATKKASEDLKKSMESAQNLSDQQKDTDEKINAAKALIEEYKNKATGVTEEERKKQIDSLTKSINELQKQSDTLKAEATKTEKEAKERYNNETQSAKATFDSKNQKIDQTLNNKKTEIQKQTDFSKAIDLDKESFNVGILLKAKNQKTFFEKAASSGRPVIIEVIDQITTLMLRLIIPISVLALIIGGYFMMFAQGEESMLNTGKSILKNTAVGLVLIFSSFLIVQFVISIFYK